MIKSIKLSAPYGVWYWVRGYLLYIMHILPHLNARKEKQPFFTEWAENHIFFTHTPRTGFPPFKSKVTEFL